MDKLKSALAMESNRSRVSYNNNNNNGGDHNNNNNNSHRNGSLRKSIMGMILGGGSTSWADVSDITTMIQSDASIDVTASTSSSRHIPKDSLATGNTTTGTSRMEQLTRDSKHDTMPIIPTKRSSGMSFSIPEASLAEASLQEIEETTYGGVLQEIEESTTIGDGSTSCGNSFAEESTVEISSRADASEAILSHSSRQSHSLPPPAPPVKPYVPDTPPKMAVRVASQSSVLSEASDCSLDD